VVPCATKTEFGLGRAQMSIGPRRPTGASKSELEEDSSGPRDRAACSHSVSFLTCHLKCLLEGI
jgi:hypothetical protein